MSNDLLLFSGRFDTDMKIPFYSGGIQAGIPHDAQNFPAESVDFNSMFITHPDATFYARVDTDGMEAAGIMKGDLVVIDRAETAGDGDIVVVFLDGEFKIGALDTSEREQGRIIIRQGDGGSTFILPAEGFVEWGVVIWSMRHRI